MTTKLMTNIDSYFYNFIDLESRKYKISKRELLEKIILSYIEEQKIKKIESWYKAMWEDDDYLSEMVDNTEYLGNL